MIEGRVVIIPFLEGRKNSQGRMIVPNMDAIQKLVAHLIPNPIVKVLSTLSCHTVSHLLIGGHH